uniref:Natural cytotoxicity triggering receptor 3 n=1 Tax=Erpetoichthys calabaricus TaxID=27687 RepID=A0A8C4RSB8_ERPCA
LKWLFLFHPDYNGSEQLQVHQNPEVTFNLGQNAHLPCRFNARNVVQIGSYKWYKDHVGGTEVSNGTHGKAILKTNIETFIKDKNASITILQPSHNDSGYYYCEVDLLGIGRANGSGTLLRVNEGTVQLILHNSPPTVSTCLFYYNWKKECVRNCILYWENI